MGQHEGKAMTDEAGFKTPHLPIIYDLCWWWKFVRIRTYCVQTGELLCHGVWLKSPLLR